MYKTAALVMALVVGGSVANMANAQDALASDAQAVLANAEPIHVKLRIVQIDRAARVVTLRGPLGNDTEVAVGPQVENFDKLKVGDTVDVVYKNALLVTAEKITGKDKGIRERIDTNVYVPGATGYDFARQIEVQATVERINLKKRQVTLRGVYHTVTLDVAPDVDLANVKRGDTIHAVFVSAYATQVTPVTSVQ